MNNDKPDYVTQAELTDLGACIANAIKAQSETLDGLRMTTLLLAASLAKQDAIDKAKLIADISALIEKNYPQEDSIPISVLDFRTTLIKFFNLDKGGS